MYDAENVAFKFSRLRRHLKCSISLPTFFQCLWIFGLKYSGVRQYSGRSRGGSDLCLYVGKPRRTSRLISVELLILTRRNLLQLRHRIWIWSGFWDLWSWRIPSKVTGVFAYSNGNYSSAPVLADENRQFSWCLIVLNDLSSRIRLGRD